MLRPPLNSWRRDKSVEGLGFWFWVPIGSARKTRQQSNWQFINCLVKRDFTQATPNISILYTVGNHFSPWLTMWDSYLKTRSRLVRLHCQSFDSLSRKACFEFRPLSSRTNGTIMIMGSNGTCWYPEPPSKVAGDGGSTRPTVAHPRSATTTKHCSPLCTEPPTAKSSTLRSLPRCLPPLNGRRSLFAMCPYVEEWERAKTVREGESYGMREKRGEREGRGRLREGVLDMWEEDTGDHGCWEGKILTGRRIKREGNSGRARRLM